MKLESAGESVMEMLLSDDWVVEQKMDGTRGLIRVTSEGVDWNGLAHTAATQWASKIESGLADLRQLMGEFWLDGEIMIENGEYRVFDLPYLRVGGQLPFVEVGTPLKERRSYLETLALWFREPVSLVSQARGSEKAELIQRAEAVGAEGVVFKHLDYGYQPGQRVRHQLKHQFVKRADLVVMDRKPNSATLGVYREGALVKMGKTSMIGKEDAQPGDVIELKFLYLTAAGALYQPRMVRLREDKLPIECTFDQFSSYTREAV